MSMAVFALPRTEASDMLPRYISMRPSAAGFTTALNSPDLSPNRVYIEFVLTPLSADILRRFASWNPYFRNSFFALSSSASVTPAVSCLIMYHLF